VTRKLSVQVRFRAPLEGRSRTGGRGGDQSAPIVVDAPCAHHPPAPQAISERTPSGQGTGPGQGAGLVTPEVQHGRYHTSDTAFVAQPVTNNSLVARVVLLLWWSLT
jgi:hypothetical protein